MFNKKISIKKLFYFLAIGITVSVAAAFMFQKHKISEFTRTSFEAYKSQCDFSGMSKETRTYTNKIYNFTFTYPQDYIVCEIRSPDSKGEYGENVNIHVMPKKLFESSNAKYITTHNIQDSLLLEIFKSTESQTPRASLKEILPNKMINGIEATVGIAQILGCKKSSCPRVVVTKFTRNDISYEFGAVQPFEEIFDTFIFSVKK